MKLNAKAIGAASSLLFAAAAHADLTSTLSFSDASAGLGAGPYATIVVTQGANANTVNITETLVSPYALVDTGGPHHALAFSIAGTESISIGGATGFSLLTGGVTNTPFGQYEYALTCNVCGKGGSNPFAGPLSFSITSNTALDPSKFVANAGGFVFSSDVVNTTTGRTGNVAGGIATVTPVPEPETYALMLAGLGAIGFIGKRRKAV